MKTETINFRTGSKFGKKVHHSWTFAHNLSVVSNYTLELLFDMWCDEPETTDLMDQPAFMAYVKSKNPQIEIYATTL